MTPRVCSRRRRVLGPAALLAALCAIPIPAGRAVAQDTAGTAGSNRGPKGFGPASAARQAEFERALLGAIAPDSSARWARTLAARPHVAGTPAQAATRDSVVRWLGEAGLDVGYDSLVLYMPRPIEVRLSQTVPERRSLDLQEPPIPGDPATRIDPTPVFSAYSGSGVAEGEIVYAGYGLPDDYAVLDSLGVSVRDRVVLARYGKSFRGIKAREAARRGAAGLLLFSDPAQDGAGRGPVYPDGPWRPPHGVERGSLLLADGDPSTPGVPSVPGAPRLPEDEMEGLAGLPVAPVPSAVAGTLLADLAGFEVPEAWQGDLPVDYRTGPGPAAVRLEVRMEQGADAYHAAFNTVAAVRGTEWPDEWVIVGAHRDAWGPGAMDNVGGTTSVITAARAFAAAARAGFRPRRTVVFATWDAEEWGVMGSIEWVESLAERLRATAVAYVNQDVPVSGSRFGAAAAPELADLVRAASAAVPDPETGRPVGTLWLEAAREQVRDADAPPSEAPVRTMGGGSDHMGFYLHLGIPSTGFGFGGAGGGVYHSMYDTAEWMQRFGDPGYRYHAAAAGIAAVLLARLANADVLPLDHVALARRAEEELSRLEPEVDQALHVAGAPLAAAPGVADQPAPAGNDAADRLHAALTAAMRAAAGLEDAAAAFAAERDRRLEWGRPDPETARRVNAALRAIGPETAAEEGPTGEEWSRNVLVATDPDNGYAALALPGVRLALRRGDLEEAARGLGALTRALERAAARVKEASEALGP